ncbi:hypothetical protein CL634_02900 [bacterium]|nr:hypothetical protein [bacterium]
MTEASQAVFKAIAFFDIFAHPLTAWEVKRFAFGKSLSLFQVRHCLAELIELGKISQHDGFYYLVGRFEIVRIRHQRHALSIAKYKIARRVAGWIAGLPYVRGVAVVNTLAFDSARADSDIDLLILVKTGRLWAARLIVTLVVQLLGLRRHGIKIANRACLSFYLDEKAIDLTKIKLSSDPYLAYWMSTIVPLYGRPVFQKMHSQNEWQKNLVPGTWLSRPNFLRRVRLNKFSQGNKKMAEFLSGKWLEVLAKEIQMSKIIRNKKSVAGAPDSRVVISDHMLKFHESDRRVEYAQAWQNMIADN